MQPFLPFLTGLAAAVLAPAAWAQDPVVDPVETVEQTTAIVQDYEPSPAIWKLADEDTTIYLFGTFHLLPEGFRWRSPELDRVIDRSDELVLETSDADSVAGSRNLMPRLSSGIDDRVPTSQRLSPEAGEKWLRLAEATSMPLAAFDRMPPILAIIAVGLGQLNDMGAARENGVEAALQTHFAEAGKPIGSIENAADVFANLLAIDENILLAEMEEELLAWDGVDIEEFFLGDGQDWKGLDLALEHRWAQGEPIDDLDFGKGEFGVLMEKVLMEDRNRAWAEWLDERLERPGTVLVAVGAGHFFGPTSVQTMLAERGLAAQRLD